MTLFSPYEHLVPLLFSQIDIEFLHNHYATSFGVVTEGVPTFSVDVVLKVIRRVEEAFLHYPLYL